MFITQFCFLKIMLTRIDTNERISRPKNLYLKTVQTQENTENENRTRFLALEQFFVKNLNVLKDNIKLIDEEEIKKFICKEFEDLDDPEIPYLNDVIQYFREPSLKLLTPLVNTFQKVVTYILRAKNNQLIYTYTRKMNLLKI